MPTKTKWPLISAAKFERAYAARSGVTVAWLRENDQVIARCNCREEGCGGWQSVSREFAETNGLEVRP